MKKKALIIPAKGIGDALIMMGASHALLSQGFAVTTFHSHLPELQVWFPGHHFCSTLPTNLADFSLIVIENDNSPMMHFWKSHYPQAIILYPSYCAAKNPPLSTGDSLFNPHLTMAENITRAFNGRVENGISPPSHLTHRKNPQRILIHPTSSSPEKNWPKKRFLKLQNALSAKGFDAQFIMSPEEKKSWNEQVISCQTLSELATYVYESGGMIGNDSLMGHLASNLNIPNVVIANDAERMKLWRPGWLKGAVVTPPRWVPNFKFCRLRRTQWKRWISVNTVLRAFENNLLHQA